MNKINGMNLYNKNVSITLIKIYLKEKDSFIDMNVVYNQQ